METVAANPARNTAALVVWYGAIACFAAALGGFLPTELAIAFGVAELGATLLAGSAVTAPAGLPSNSVLGPNAAVIGTVLLTLCCIAAGLCVGVAVR